LIGLLSLFLIGGKEARKLGGHKVEFLNVCVPYNSFELSAVSYKLLSPEFA
jgi:hypothetical protein